MCAVADKTKKRRKVAYFPIFQSTTRSSLNLNTEEFACPKFRMSSKSNQMKTAKAPSPSATEPKTTKSFYGPKTQPVNRNVYESVGNEAATGATGVGGGGSSKAKVVNRNLYEAVAPDTAEAPKGGTNYGVLDKIDTAGGIDKTTDREPVMEDSSARSASRREKRRRRRQMMEAETAFSGATKVTVVLCSVLLALVLILAAIGVAIYLLTPDKGAPPATPPQIVVTGLMATRPAWRNSSMTGQRKNASSSCQRRGKPSWKKGRPAPWFVAQSTFSRRL